MAKVLDPWRSQQVPFTPVPEPGSGLVSSRNSIADTMKNLFVPLLGEEGASNAVNLFLSLLAPENRGKTQQPPSTKKISTASLRKELIKQEGKSGSPDYKKNWKVCFFTCLHMQGESNFVPDMYLPYHLQLPPDHTSN